MMNRSAEVLFKQVPGNKGDIGLIILNKPQVLNSLSHTMLISIHQQLKKWAIDKTIKAVVIQATEGKAFCAGGDLRLAYERHEVKDPLLIKYFRDEYDLNKYIYHYPKPYIAFLDGITMGGGAGISIHGSHCIATERLIFAMPETGIGFYPDIGGTYFLPRLPDNSGIYLGLTGQRLSSDACVELGIAKIKVASKNLPNLFQKLVEVDLQDEPKKLITQVIEPFKMDVSKNNFYSLYEIIRSAFSEPTMERIIAMLRNIDHDAARDTLTELDKKSPTSLKVTLKALQRGAEMDFDHCMEQEFILTSNFLCGHDFFEGIRALIIDKDNQPKWFPLCLEEVSEAQVTKYFLANTLKCATNSLG